MRDYSGISAFDQVMKILTSSSRRASAYYSSRSFCVDTELLDPSDDAAMAERAYYEAKATIFKLNVNDKVKEALCMTGEDIMLARYLFNKLGGSGSKDFLYIKQEILYKAKENNYSIRKEYEDGLSENETTEFFTACENYGYKRASQGPKKKGLFSIFG